MAISASIQPSEFILGRISGTSGIAMKPSEVEITVRRLASMQCPKAPCPPCGPTSSVQELPPSLPQCQRSKPEAFVKLVVLVSMMTIFEPEKELVYLELFAGRARLTRLARSLGYPAKAHDFAFDIEAKNNLDRNNCMDLTSDAGYLLLGSGA